MPWRLCQTLANPTVEVLAATAAIPILPAASLSFSFFLYIFLSFSLLSPSHVLPLYKTANASATPTDAATSNC